MTKTRSVPLVVMAMLVAALVAVPGMAQSPSASQAPSPSTVQKVILDSDMVELFDDGMAMIMLDRSPDIDLLGVTVVAGNSPMPKGVATGVRQLEAIGSTTPIYEGSRYGIKFWRGANPAALAAEEVVSPVTGWAGYLKPYETGSAADPMADWQQVYQDVYGEQPTYGYVYGPGKPDPNGNDEAVQFLIDSVDKYPGEITIVAIGPLTNIARAIMQDPTFSSKVKQIAYMGGSFYLPGNSSSAAEFNWWADPDAAKIAVRSQWGDPNSETYKLWGNQMIDGLEANNNTGGMPEDLYPKMVANTFPGIQELFLKREAEIKANDWGSVVPDNIWDLFAASWVIDPSTVLSWNDAERPASGVPEAMSGVYVDVDSDSGMNYGRATAFTDTQGPVGTQKGAIQNFIDEQHFWNDIVYPLTVDPSKQ
jgi:inosine-uridine nucleoside N-ribohydrolase